MDAYDDLMELALILRFSFDGIHRHRNHLPSSICSKGHRTITRSYHVLAGALSPRRQDMVDLVKRGLEQFHFERKTSDTSRSNEIF